MKTYIYHTVNEGLFFWNGKDGLLIDGIHEGKQVGFSNMPPLLLSQLQTNSGFFHMTNQLLFTHLHKDHFSSIGLEYMMHQHPSALVYGPGLSRNNVKEEVLTTQIHQLRFPSGKVYAKNTIHDGEQFKMDLHQSFLVTRDQESFFVAGDAILTEEDIKAFQPYIGESITAGFFNLYQLYSPEGQNFVRSLPFERVFLYHLPFPEDDNYNYAKLAKQISKNPPEGLPKAEILSHMAWIDGRQPRNWFENNFIPSSQEKQQKNCMKNY